jgi:hypothetical protein
VTRYRITDAVNSLLGSSSPRGDLVRMSSGVHTNRDDAGLPETLSSIDPCSPHRHGKLRGQKRCFGCGRTRNEIEIDEGIK